MLISVPLCKIRSDAKEGNKIAAPVKKTMPSETMIVIVQ